MKKTMSMLATALLLLTACDSGRADSSLDETCIVSGGSTENRADNSDGAGTSDSTNSIHNSTSESDTAPSEQSAPESAPREKPTVSENPQGGDMYESGVLVLNDGCAFNLYGGGYEEGRNYAESLNQIKKRVGDKVNVFSMVIPTEVSFYLPKKYADYSGSEWYNIEYLNGFFDGIIPVDAYTALSRHVDEEIYFRTDFHWQQLGVITPPRSSPRPL